MTNQGQIAEAFGRTLDQDDFDSTKQLLSPNCIYAIGDSALIGPDAICGSYQQNMIDGREKLDELVWGASWIEPVTETEYLVHFTDYLKHNGVSYTHRCQQKLTIQEDGLISRIDHIDDSAEQARLDAYYQSVGLK